MSRKFQPIEHSGWSLSRQIFAHHNSNVSAPLSKHQQKTIAIKYLNSLSKLKIFSKANEFALNASFCAIDLVFVSISGSDYRLWISIISVDFIRNRHDSANNPRAAQLEPRDACNSIPHNCMQLNPTVRPFIGSTSKRLAIRCEMSLIENTWLKLDVGQRFRNYFH